VVGLVAESLAAMKYVTKYCPRSRPCWEHGNAEMKRVFTFLPGVCICLPPCMVRTMSQKTAVLIKTWTSLSHRPRMPRGGEEIEFYSFFNLARMGVDGQRHASAALPPVKRRGTHFTEGLGGLQGRSGRVRKISRPLGFDPRTVQPVASSYAILAHSLLNS
jgi:hypothetical protein